jgi:NAD(P)-dependent dehydrogenase (short-subunit alcohol dehydrogenase family)
VAVCARDAGEVERARVELSRTAPVLAAECDLTDRAQVESLVRRVEQTLGPIDVLVNNAVIIQVGPAEEMTLGDFDRAMATHFFAPLQLIWAVLPQMRRRKGGRIVNISSVGGRLPAPHLLPYVASKYALTGLSEGLSVELAKAGIRVTTVCPGLMRTGSPGGALFKGQHRREYAWFKLSASLPLVTLSSQRAAQKILDACERGRAELILTPAASLGARLHGAWPELTVRILRAVNALLPGPGGIHTAETRGRQSETRFSRMWGVASDRAAAANNEPLS